MALVSAILKGPPLFCLLIWVRIQHSSFLLYRGYAVKRTIDPAAVGQLVEWTVLGIGVLVVIGFIIKFMVEGLDIKTWETKEIRLVAGNVLWRAFVVLLLYAVFSFLFYLFAGFTGMVSKEMEYLPPGR